MTSERSWHKSGDVAEPPRAAALVAGALVATLAFWAYTRTLLPGVDLGDTGAFQAAVVSSDVSARQAYPLYYALARPFVATVAPHHAAAALNLFSAVWAALAVALLTIVCAATTRSIRGGVAAGLFLACSYTFWTQAIIAEVYSMHLALVGVCLAALLAYESRPSGPRLTVFFCVYALAFGNHLSMILLLLPFTGFLLMTAERPRSLFELRTVVLAASIATIGAVQYLPNVSAVWLSLDAPERWIDRLAAFWFDVTKSDWRESMVLGVQTNQALDHARMFWFDARQQFGMIGLLVACVGAARLWTISRRWAVLVLSAYAINALFASTYNVGDPHVFFLPGHYFVAFLIGAALPSPQRSLFWRSISTSAFVLMVTYASWRWFDTWPAVDRHVDRRGEQLVERLTFGLNDQNALLVTQLNWQTENALLYAGRSDKREVVWVRLSDVMLHFPFLVTDNEAIGRDVVLTSVAARQVAAAYGNLFPLIPDDFPLPLPVAVVAEQIPRGAPYTLGLLTPPRDESLNATDIDAALNTLTAGHQRRHQRSFEVIAGLAGESARLSRAADEPFRVRVTIDAADFDIRMESWLPTETFRRGGFGHIIRNHRHVLTLERGISLVWFGRSGEIAGQYYAAGLYAIQPRFRIPAEGVPHLARATLGRASLPEMESGR
jgi:hypothetical protein